MTKPELIAAIEALGWYDLKSSYEKASAKHADHDGGWMVWHEPGPGELPILTLFLRDIKGLALLKEHLTAMSEREAKDQQTIQQTLARLRHD